MKQLLQQRNKSCSHFIEKLKNQPIKYTVDHDHFYVEGYYTAIHPFFNPCFFKWRKVLAPNEIYYNNENKQKDILLCNSIISHISFTILNHALENIFLKTIIH